jgi:hypothetical protein
MARKLNKKASDFLRDKLPESKYEVVRREFPI